MMKSMLSTAAAIFAVSAAVAPAIAAEAGPKSVNETAAEAGAGQYVGMSVYDATGQEVGTIEKIVVTADGSEEVIVSVGGFLGIGSKKIAVPTSELMLNAEGTGYTTALTVDEIEAAPAYEGGESDAM